MSANDSVAHLQKETVSMIGSDGQLRVVERHVPEKKQTPAQMVADKLGISYHSDEKNGHLTTSEAGKIGGHLGGPMVKKLVSLAREEMAKAHVDKMIEANKRAKK